MHAAERPCGGRASRPMRVAPCPPKPERSSNDSRRAPCDDSERLRSKTRCDPMFVGDEFVSMHSTFDVRARWILIPPAHEWLGPSCAQSISAKVAAAILRRLLRLP